jgi:hypothetical protein
MSSSKLSESKQSETDSIDISKISKSEKSSSLSKSKSKTKSEKNEDSKINTISNKSKESKNTKGTKDSKGTKKTKDAKDKKGLKHSQPLNELNEIKIDELDLEKKTEKTEKEGHPENQDKGIREKEISDLAKMLLKKNLDGRRFYEERIKNWSQAILDEMWNYLLEKYPKFGFGILVFIAEDHEYFTAGQAIFNRDLDSKIIEKYQSQNMSAILVVFFVKKRKRNIEILYIDPEHFFNINRIFAVSLEKREWSEKYEKYLVNAVNDINTYLIKDISLGKSFLQGFVFRNNYVRMHANFKFGNVEFLPYITSYSNDAVIAYLFSFFLNN